MAKSESFEVVLIQKYTKRPMGDCWAVSELSTTELCNYKADNNIALIASNKWVVLDVEGKKKGKDGWATLSNLVRVYGNLPMTLEYTTPSGGGGLIFKQPKGKSVPFVDLSASHGLELRTGKHYNLLPPSIFKGDKYEGEYTWITSPQDMLDVEEEIPEVPDWLVEFFVSEKELSQPEQKGTSNDTSYFNNSYLPILENNIFKLDADCSYPTWWSVMAVCHRAGAKELFLEWSATAKQKWRGEQTKRFIDAQWRTLDKKVNKATDQPMLGITWFLEQVAAVEPEPLPIFNEPAKVSQQNAPVSIPQLAIPCSGVVKSIVDEVRQQIPHQESYGYLAAVCILGTLAQRLIKTRTKPMQYYVLYTDPNAQKTTIKNCIDNAIDRALPEAMMDHPASAQALQEIFAENPNRYYSNDEAIAKMCSIYSPKSHTSGAKIEAYELLLEYFGNPPKVTGQRNKKKEDSTASAVHPRLTWLCIGPYGEWKKLLNSERFIASGMASRFAPFSGKTKIESYAEFKKRKSSDLTLSDGVIKQLQTLYGVRQLSSRNAPKLVEFDEEETDIDMAFGEELVRREAQATGEGKAAIWGRLKERINWYAALHCFGNDRHIIQEEDVAFGLGLCQYHLKLWEDCLGEAEIDDVTRCMDAVMNLATKLKIFTMRDVHQRISSEFRSTDYCKLRKEAISILLGDKIEMVPHSSKMKLKGL